MSRFMCRRNLRQRRNKRRRGSPFSPGTSDDELLGYGVPAEWLNDVKKATEDTLLALADHLPAEAAEALLELATGGKPRVPQPARGGGESLRSSRCPAPLPRDDERRGVAARPRFPVGEMDGLPAPRAAAMGGARLHRPGARLRFGGHRQDHRRLAPGRSSGAHASRRPRPADDLLRHAGECAANQAEAAVGQ